MLFWALCFSSKKKHVLFLFFKKKQKKKAWEKPSLNAAVGGECGRRRQPRQVAHVHRLDEAHLVDLHQRPHERRVRPGSCWVPLLQRTEKTLKMFFKKDPLGKGAGWKKTRCLDKQPCFKFSNISMFLGIYLIIIQIELNLNLI